LLEARATIGFDLVCEINLHRARHFNAAGLGNFLGEAEIIGDIAAECRALFSGFTLH
jgi:hypothetical protein